LKEGDFICVVDGRSEDLGIGKIDDCGEGFARISYFDSPVGDPIHREVPVEFIQPAKLSPQTRVYWNDIRHDVWRVGRVFEHDGDEVDVRFPNQHDRFIATSELFVRWDRPLEDPTPYLAQKINETPIFSDARSEFMKSLISQRTASMGMPALFSSVIDLEPHQIEVVRRVLQDPVQRYLLADEVGLGKTIEAGVLIRQYVLDDPQGHKVVVIVPPSLRLQWRDELKRRFLLHTALDESVHVVAFDDRRGVEECLRDAGMVVVDEAHHVRRGDWLFDLLAAQASNTPRFLLLSATPVLGDETGFLEMLHLLDPLVFSLNDQDAFRRKISNRQVLAEAVAGLIPENLLQIEDYLDTLTNLFDDDELLLALADPLRRIVEDFPDETDPEFLDALVALRAHVAETYRLDRRILRNRRVGVPGLTPDRAGVTFIDYHSPAMVRFSTSLEEWRSHVALKYYDLETTIEANHAARQFVEIENAVLSRMPFTTLITDLLEPRLSEADQIESLALREMISALDLRPSELGGIDTLANAIGGSLESTKFIVFCSGVETAKFVALGLSDRLTIPIDQFEEIRTDDYENSSLSDFLSDPKHRVLVCDHRSEEGLNLQGGNKVLIHFDLPLSPNRIEQRIGRIDRYGTGASVQSIVVRCTSNPFEMAWTDCLVRGFEVFDRSIASLQYLVDEEMHSLQTTLLFEGVDGLASMADRLGGSGGQIAEELRRIDDQDALDALIVSDEGSFDELFDEDDRWQEFQKSVDAWLVGVLMMQKGDGPDVGPLPTGDSTFRYVMSRQGKHKSIIPLDKFVQNFISVLDTDFPGASSKRPSSFPFTFRRRTALSRRAREQNVRLIRYGDTFLQGLTEITSLDDRGRSVAMWRQRTDYQATNLADVFFRFDFVIEADIAEAASYYASEINGSTETAEAAFRRRGDMVLPPIFHRVWLDSELEVVTDRELVNLLEEPYQPKSVQRGRQDRNLNSDRWSFVNGLGLSVMDYWPDLVFQARDKAETVLRRMENIEERIRTALQSALILDEGRFAQLRTRIQHADVEYSASERRLLQIEMQATEFLYDGIRSYRVGLDTIGTTFLSPQALDYLMLMKRQLKN
jgi:ATP-dependent helicase HepA